MGFIGKIFAFAMFPLSIIIALDTMGVYSVPLTFLPIDKVILGAILMVVLQLITLFMLFITHKQLTFMNIITTAIFILVAVGAVVAGMVEFHSVEATLILSVMMFVEALYALH